MSREEASKSDEDFVQVNLEEVKIEEKEVSNFNNPGQSNPYKRPPQPQSATPTGNQILKSS
jgi:hypothetical protein